MPAGGLIFCNFHALRSARWHCIECAGSPMLSAVVLLAKGDVVVSGVQEA